jgi:peptidoglycan/LPS O-acetylase OafA/YrhL
LCLLPLCVRTLNGFGMTNRGFLLISTVLTSLTITIALSTAMYHFVEAPTIRFSHWLTNRQQGARGTDAASCPALARDLGPNRAPATRESQDAKL